MINLAILDDNRMLRLGLASALESGCGIELVGLFDLTDESISEVENLRPAPGADGNAVAGDEQDRHL